MAKIKNIEAQTKIKYSYKKKECIRNQFLNSGLIIFLIWMLLFRTRTKVSYI